MLTAAIRTRNGKKRDERIFMGGRERRILLSLLTITIDGSP
jgi:hypothetical protein